VVIVDDVASSGGTVAVTAKAALQAGASRVHLMVTHGLFARGCIERIRQAGVREVWSTDSIPHSSNVVGLASLLAQALAESNQVRMVTDGIR
jgi:ribose-phosphate pyrophosphokinase